MIRPKCVDACRILTKLADGELLGFRILADLEHGRVSVRDVCSFWSLFEWFLILGYLSDHNIKKIPTPTLVFRKGPYI